MTKIAVIGAGNMGSAIAASLPEGEFDVVCTAASPSTLDRIKASIPHAHTTLSNEEAVEGADIVVLAVKPYIAPEVLPRIEPHIKPGATVLSVIAALPIASLSEQLDARRKGLSVIRVIPNTAIRLGKSATFIAAAPEAEKEAVGKAVEIFNRSGKAFVIPEKDMAACTALASCGIAYFLRFIRAAAEGSVELGLRPGFATEVAAVTAEGAAALLKENGAHPEAEIDKVTTPGGLTIKGLNALEANGFTAAVIAALKASV